MTEKIMRMRAEEWKSASFIVRFYRGLAHDANAWQGQVEHVQSSQKRTFHGAQELLTIMDSLSKEKERDSYPKEESR